MSVCPFHDCSDHIWQVRQTHKCDTSSGTIFQHELNGDVSFVIQVTIYGYNVKTKIQDKEVHLNIYNVKAKIQDNLNTMSKVLYIIWNRFLM